MAARIFESITPDGQSLEKTLEELKRLEVRIGFQRGDAEDENGVDMCDIAAWNELGTSRSPARPFMRQTVDNHEDAINAMLLRKKREIISGVSAEQILKSIGLEMKDLMQAEIIEGDFAPNAPSTIRRKKSSRPLIDTGRMRQSVNFQIKEKGEMDD